MNDLVVICYPDEHRAYEVWAELVKLRHDYLVGPGGRGHHLAR